MSDGIDIGITNYPANSKDVKLRTLALGLGTGDKGLLLVEFDENDEGGVRFELSIDSWLEHEEIPEFLENVAQVLLAAANSPSIQDDIALAKIEAYEEDED